MILPPRLKRMAALVGGEAGMNRAIHVWRDPAFVFLATPVCACSTLKATLNLSVARVSGNREFRIDNAKMIHDRKENLLLTPRQIGYDRFEEMLDDPSVPLFAFVRGPEGRFLSAWRKKLTKENGFTLKVREHLGVGPRVPLAKFLTLDHFAAGVAADPELRDLDVHWRLQRKQIFFDELPRLTLGFLEDFTADSARILGGIFGAGNYVFRDAVELNKANASGNRKAVPGLSEAARAHVVQAYAADIEMIAEARRLRSESESR
jgi:hypothetical protein